MRSNQPDLTKDELEAIKQLGVAIGNAMGDFPTPHRLYAVVMYLADTIIADSPDAAEARKILDNFRDTVDLEMSAMRCSGQRLSDVA